MCWRSGGASAESPHLSRGGSAHRLGECQASGKLAAQQGVGFDRLGASLGIPVHLFACVRKKCITNQKLDAVFCGLTCDGSTLRNVKSPKIFVCCQRKAFKGKKCLSGSLRLLCGDLTKFLFEKEGRQSKGERMRGHNVVSPIT